MDRGDVRVPRRELPGRGPGVVGPGDHRQQRRSRRGDARFQKRTVLFVAQMLLLVSSTWIGFELVLDSVEYWMLLVSSALQAAAFSLFAPARMAYTAELVPGRNLSNAIVLSGMSAEGMRVIGPTIAGMAIGAFVWGMQVVYLVSSSILVIGIVLTFTLPRARRRAADIDTTPLQEIADGERAGTELVFSTPANSDRRAWLVELSRDGITALLLGSGRTERLGVDAGAGSRFATWCGGLTPQGDYCLLLERPSAADQLRTDAEERLKERCVPFGIELVGEEQTVRDGSAQPAATP
ncbi:MAG: MFS transporter [Actinobacteria bacterium]|nr:MFS transporter [Actinomycetota bacterium]